MALMSAGNRLSLMDGIGHGRGTGEGPLHHQGSLRQAQEGVSLWNAVSRLLPILDWPLTTQKPTPEKAGPQPRHSSSPVVPPALGETQQEELRMAVQQLPPSGGIGLANWTL